MLRKLLCIMIFCLLGSVYAATTTVINAYVPKTGESAGTCNNAGASFTDCVQQTGVAWPNPRFVAYVNSVYAADNCTTDKLSGLMWVNNIQASNINSITGSTVGWSSIQGKINSINALNGGKGYCGYNDWRLPNINELKSLVNYGQASPATWLNNTGFFANVQQGGTNFYWSSSVNASNPTVYSWYVDFGDGFTSRVGSQNTANYFFWPVRGGQ